MTQSQNEEQKVTSVQDFRNKIGEARLFKLPDVGLCLKIKRLSPIVYLKEGMTDIPNDFFKFIGELKAQRIDAPDLTDERAMKNYDIFEKFLEITIRKGVVEPPMLLKLDPQKKEQLDENILFSELSTKDQQALVNEITGFISV